ncbi:MAG: hypothetical protein KF795_24095 [Labilithrix sp.]|nr:hypothetical protein [Labilithrix sp.]
MGPSGSSRCGARPGSRPRPAVAAWRAPAIFACLLAFGCSRTPPPSGDRPAARPAVTNGAGAAAPSDTPASASALPPGAASCTAAGGPTCYRFATAEDAFRWVLAKDPLVLAVGEAHAQRGTEHIASSTKRFTDAFLPLLAPRATDVVVELWAPDPKCMKEVKAVASAQKPVTDVQAETNQNEYVTLGTKAKAAGMTPWLLRPTCDDFAMLSDAGADAVGAMLGLVKRLTQAKVAALHAKNKADGGAAPKAVIAYGGALHNDLSPPEATREYSFGPELDQLTGGRYVELDLIVPEFVKKTPVWEKLPWYASFEAEQASGQPRDKATLYVVGERSFVLVFASSSPAAPPPK